ncbi:MAG: efflux RND transporter permease subunit [bacterium]|nr:efflux RND transporter permease subunit [bacterium]
MKRWINFGLKNRLLMLVLAIVVMITGYMSYQKLPIDAFPDVSPNLVQVFTTTEGLAPEEIEKYVTFPVETAMNGLPGIQKIRSVSNFGLSVVNIYFEDSMDLYFARQLVGERLLEAREQIPEGFGEPELGPIATGMGLVLFYYLEDSTGMRSLTELRSIQDWIIKFQLQNVPGVTEVLGIGGYEKQFHVVINPHALLQYHVTLPQVIEKIKANNLNVGAQFIEKNSEEYIVRSIGLATSIEDISNIVINSEKGTPVYLKDLAEIEIGGAVRRGIQTRNGVGEVVAGMVVKLFGTNSSTVISAVEQSLDRLNKSLPEGLKIVPYYEQKSLVAACVQTVTNALLQGILLVVFVLFVFMGGIRPGLVVTLSIPFSVLFALTGMHLFGISANLMSFGGLAIAIGIMVDGTIVLIENIDRILKEPTKSESRIHEISRACVEVAKPVMFAITIIIVVFLPLLTLQGVEGKTFKPLAFTIALSMLGSLLFAILIAPAMSYFLMKEPDSKEKSNEVWIIRKIQEPYKKLVQFFIFKRIYAVLLAVVFIIVGIVVFPGLGSEFTPELQEGTLILRLAMAPSISLNKSKQLTMIVEKKLMRIKEISGVVSRIGRGEVGAHADPINSAEMYILLKPKNNWRVKSQKELKELIRKDLGETPGILTSFTQPIAMTIDELLEGIKADLAIKLFGDDLELLKQTADKIAAVVQTVNGAKDIQVDQIAGTPQLQIKINRQAIAKYGINVADAQSIIQSAIGGEIVGQVFEDIRRFDILVRFKQKFRDNKEDIEGLLVDGPNGLKIPLSQLASIEEITGPRQITRENNQRFITIQCNVSGRDIGSFVEETQRVINQKIKLPIGYFTTWGGQFRLQQEANKRFAIVIPLTIGLVFFLLFLHFNSVKNALLILLNIPLALVGGVVALWITGQNLSVPSSVGFIALFGIALGNGMVLVVYLNHLLREGFSMTQASIRGAVLRLKPVLMTALTTALGLIPLLFSAGTGSEVQRPLATVVVGGLISSTILTLLVIPAIYKWFAINVEKEVVSVD